jgi:hypothetical protein
MHPNLDELLAYRDGDGTADAARHVERCDHCRAELENLRAKSIALRDLPSISPPRDAWPEIRRRIVSRRRRRTRVRLALAAACVLVAATATLVARFEQLSTDPGRLPDSDVRAAIEQLSSASRELEMVLHESSMHSPVLSPRQAAMIVEIEDRIALLDLALAQNTYEQGGREVLLWSDRVQLLDALVAARGGGTRTESLASAINRKEGSYR